MSSSYCKFRRRRWWQLWSKTWVSKRQGLDCLQGAGTSDRHSQTLNPKLFGDHSIHCHVLCQVNVRCLARSIKKLHALAIGLRWRVYWIQLPAIRRLKRKHIALLMCPYPFWLKPCSSVAIHFFRSLSFGCWGWRPFLCNDGSHRGHRNRRGPFWQQPSSFVCLFEQSHGKQATSSKLSSSGWGLRRHRLL